MSAMIYQIAGLNFKINMPEGWSVKDVLPSFAPFQSANFDIEDNFVSDIVIFNDLNYEILSKNTSDSLLLEKSENPLNAYLYRNTDDYLFVEKNNNDEVLGFVTCSADFKKAALYVVPSLNIIYLSRLVSSLLRFVYSQAVIFYDALTIHASAVVWENKAYLFLGKSGTGKSTHTSLWIRNFEGAHLLNDDNPTIRFVGERAIAYGTPWSGKTPCYKNESYPIGGITLLEQASENHFMSKHGLEALTMLSPSCSVVRSNKMLSNLHFDTLEKIVSFVKIGKLLCLPNDEAAKLSKQQLV